MSAMVFLRAAAHHFIEPGRRNGPFFLFMSDANAGNVDDEWNVTGMFDLEWIFSAPPAVFSAPMCCPTEVEQWMFSRLELSSR